jgi:soluble lytic murein transglycosylase-like protein
MRRQSATAGGRRLTAIRSVFIAGLAAVLLAGCASTQFPGLASIKPRPALTAETRPQDQAIPLPPAGHGDIDIMIARYSDLYDVPEPLIRRIIARESGYNPRARNGPYYGLMQIRYDTAQSMGYRGPASGLLEADNNLRYGVKYLAGAYMVGNSNADQAVRNYAHGYYYAAKRKGLLGRVGLR